MKFKTKPYAHQMKVFEKFKDEKYFALFMEMGTGKSKVAIDIASYLFDHGLINAVLLIAPNGVHSQWASEQIPQHSSVREKVYTWSSKKHFSRTYQNIWKDFLREDDRLKWFCTNVEYYSTFTYKKLFVEFVRDHRTFIIVDESTRIKNPKAKRSVNISALGRYAQYKTILTGTPVTQSPIDIWSQFDFLKRNFFERTYFVFQAHHAVMVSDINEYTGKKYHRLITPKEFNIAKNMLAKGLDVERIAAHTGLSERNIIYIKDQTVFTKYKHIEEIKQRVNPHSFFVKKEDCLDIPPKVYEKIIVEPSPEQKRIYNDLKKKLLAEYNTHELSILNKVTLTLRLAQVCGGFFPSQDLKKPEMIGTKNRKIERLKDDLYEIGDERVIIWSHFVAEIDAIYEVLSKEFKEWRIEKYYGKTDRQTRSMIINAFQEGDVKILIINQQTGSFGLNLQRATLHYFYSNNFSLEQRLQAEDRSHRAGQEQTVVYKDIIIKDSIEEKIIEALQLKMDLLEMFRRQSLREIFN